jgi:hypothetical protein
MVLHSQVGLRSVGRLSENPQPLQSPSKCLPCRHLLWITLLLSGNISGRRDVEFIWDEWLHKPAKA